MGAMIALDGLMSGTPVVAVGWGGIAISQSNYAELPQTNWPLAQVERAIIGNATGSGPAPIAASFKPFPWPAVQIDLGASHGAHIVPHHGGFSRLCLPPQLEKHFAPCQASSTTSKCSYYLENRMSCAGAGAAALAFNLLLVFAFLAPTRSIVAAIVREKELRLREGMRMLGLQVRTVLLSGGTRCCTC